MVDSSKKNREDFVISQDGDTDEEKDLGQEDYYDNQTSLLQNKSNLSYIIGGIGLAVILILLFMVLSGPSDGINSERLLALEERIQGMEQVLATVGVIGQALDQIDSNEKEINLFMERVDRFEGTITTQIDQIIKELGALHQKTGSAPAPTAKATQPVAKSAKPKKIKVHEVKAGETLYSISRRYSLTVDQLRTYNKLGKDTAIRPGQKLKLSADTGN